MTSLYRRLLGPAFDCLPRTLQNFHDVESEWRGRARFRITHGTGPLRRLVAGAARLPPAGEDVALRLRIVAVGARERWIRHFGPHKLQSVQWAQEGLLMESFGVTRLGFRLHVEPPALRLEPVGVWVLGVALPRALMPQGTGVEVGRDDGCAIRVRLEIPGLGLVAQYEGLVIAE
jgi:hypothetical protein